MACIPQSTSAKGRPDVRFLAIGCFLILLLAGALLLWRFVALRSKGTPCLVRKMPAHGVHGWRHGLLRYDGTTVRFYKLRSLNPNADMTFHRCDVTVRGHREPTVCEASFMSSEGNRVLEITCGDRDYELACSSRAAMALTAWIEAAPDRRMERLPAAALKRKFGG